jgi:hypothetical protein
MSAGTVREARKISVLVVGSTPQLFSLFQSLETLGCQCLFAQTRQELGKILEQAKLDIVLSLNAHQPLSEMMTILANLHVTIFTCCPLKMTAGGCPFFAMARIVLAHQFFA